MNHTETRNNGHRKILVVDNLEEGRQLLCGWLARRGYAVVEAAGGHEAIEVAQREVPDLILMDIKMPGLDGIGAARSIRAHTGLGHVPIVAVSADGTEHSKARADEAGFNAYLTKPVEPDELIELLNRYLPSTDGVIN